MRFGLGPVFAYERLVNARRWQAFAARSFTVTALLFAMAAIASTSDDVSVPITGQRYARLGKYYFNALIGVELALVMLVAPAVTAGAICLDRARGNLAHLMATDLSDSEIVLGKLAARLLPVLGLVACTLPVMAISTLLGGIDPTALNLAFAIIVMVALVSCTIALALSVWARKPHEVVLATYVFWLGVLMAWPVWYSLSRGGTVLPRVGHWLLVIDPFYLAVAPYNAPTRFGLWDYALFFAAAMLISGSLMSLAVRRMRPVTIRQASAAGKEPGLGLIGRIRRWLPGPSLDGNPVLWREWHRSRPSSWMMTVVAFLGGTTGLACCIGAFTVWRDGVVVIGVSRPAQWAGIVGYVIQVALGLLMLSVSAPLSLSEERQQGSLDVLTVTPISTWVIVLGKWWGTFRLVPVLAIGPGLMAFAMATARRAGPLPAWLGRRPEIGHGYLICAAALVVVTVLAHGAAITSIGVALATWMKRKIWSNATSVCVFVMVAAGWPFLVSMIGHNFHGLRLLSPIVAAFKLGEDLTLRIHDLPDNLWWIGFWDVGVTALAIGLMWLTWRTFDEGLGRIPERARTSSVLADVIAGLGGTTLASCLYIAVTIWVVGFNLHGQNAHVQTGASCFLLFVAFGLLLLSAVAPLSCPGESRLDRCDSSVASPHSARSIVLTEWRRLFRLHALVVLGPSLIALALATTPTNDPIVRSSLPAGTVVVRTPLRSGGQIVRFFPPDPADPTRAVVLSELPLGDRLFSAAILVMTILAFGAVTIGAGLALGTWIGSRAWAIAASISLVLPVVGGWSSLGARHLFAQLVTREPQLVGLGGWAALTFSLIAYIPLVIILLRLTIRALERRARPQLQARLFTEPVPSIACGH